MMTIGLVKGLIKLIMNLVNDAENRCILCIINYHGGCYRWGGFYALLMFFGAPSAPYGYVICGVDFMHRSVDVIGGVDF
jgi:hypothetical protein